MLLDRFKDADNGQEAKVARGSVTSPLASDIRLSYSSIIPFPAVQNNNNNNNNYDNLYGAVTRPYRYKGALQAN